MRGFHLEKNNQNILQFWEKRILSICQQIEQDFWEKQDEILAEYRQQFFSLIEEVRNRSIKKSIHFVTVQILPTSIYTKSYAYRLAFYDEDFYLKQTEVSTEWSPLWIWKYFKEEAEQGRSIEKCPPWVWEETWRSYSNVYHHIVQQFCQKEAKEILSLLAELNLIAQECLFLFGMYWDKMLCLAKYEVVKGENHG
ncbi:hypothetical protein FACS189418_5590 [Clostridia bacterium]|nr:hypothetical protein FACS189418_5590 [Clostridia bacterium]